MTKTRGVVVDDSALVRSLLTEIINRQADMQCVGAAADPLVARTVVDRVRVAVAAGGGPAD
jgi:two-component system chemotaxis response regulator CheB